MSDQSNLELGCAENNIIVDATSLEFDQQKGIVFFEGNPFCGTAIVLKNTIKVASTQYKGGKKHGLTQKWFDKGVLSYEAYYKNGKQDSTSRSWWKNGNLRTMSNFKNGVAQGLQLSWYKSGAKFKAINLNNGRENGIQKAWRENGKIYNNYEAKNGRIFGLKRATLCYELEDEKIK